MMATGSGAQKVDKIQQQIDRIKKRQERFGEDVEDVSKSKINQLNRRITSLKAFEKPAEISASAVIREDSLYLYGTDYMSTRDIKEYLGTQFPSIEIKWINDSSCTLQFTSKEEAEQAYMQYSVRPAALKVKTLERTESETVNVQVPVESITSEASAKAEDADTEKPAEEEAKAADAMEADTGAAGEAAAPETTNGAMATEAPKTVVESTSIKLPT